MELLSTGQGLVSLHRMAEHSPVLCEHISLGWQCTFTHLNGSSTHLSPRQKNPAEQSLSTVHLWRAQSPPVQTSPVGQITLPSHVLRSGLQALLSLQVDPMGQGLVRQLREPQKPVSELHSWPIGQTAPVHGLGVVMHLLFTQNKLPQSASTVHSAS